MCNPSLCCLQLFLLPCTKDDGDFAMIGVNVDDTDANKDGGDGRDMGEDLSSLMSATSFSGLDNDDGIKRSSATQSTSVGTSTSFGVGDTLSLNDALFGRLSNDTTKRDTPNTTFEDLVNNLPNIGVAETSSIASSNTIDNTKNDETTVYGSTANNYVDEELLDEIGEWLLTIIPKLNENEVEVYARGLNEIGFHPECATMCELKYEDLGFMKVLHRRYLFNEITGIEHPWEA